MSMLRKPYLLLLSLLFTVNAANASLAEQNERLKLLIERAKARKEGEATPSKTAPAPASTPAPVFKQTVAPVTPAPAPVTVSVPVTPVVVPAATVIPVVVPVTPVVIPATVVPVSPAPSATPVVPTPAKVTTPSKPKATVSPKTPSAPVPERKSKVLETHPKSAEDAKAKETPAISPAPGQPSSQTVPTPSLGLPAVQAPATTIIKTINSVAQPPVQTLITPALSPIGTQGFSNSSIIQAPTIPTLSGKAVTEQVTSPKIQVQPEFQAQPAANTSNYNEVLKSIDQIIQGQKAEEQASKKTKTAPAEAAAKPVSKADDRKESHKDKEKDLKMDKNSPLINEGMTPKSKGANGETLASPADKDADYLLVLRKSLKSLEEDSWADVKYNMGESLDYFSKEKKLYPDDAKLKTYYKIILAFQRFSEGGLELDQGDFADYEDAESLYLDTQDLLEEAQKELGTDYNSEQIKSIVGSVLKYTEEELEYIEEMLGM